MKGKLINSKGFGFLIRYLYHRVPLPVQVKWRIREIISQFLSHTRGQSFPGVIRQLPLALKQQPVWNAADEYALARLMQDLSSHCAVYGPVGHIIALPFLSTGGAELVALNFARAIREIEPERSVVILVVDQDTAHNFMELPAGVKVTVLDRYLEGGAGYQRRRVLLRSLLLALRPGAFHNINSQVAWRLILEEGERLRKVTRLFASIFAFQFSPGGKRIGFAAYFLQPALPYLSGLLSDNRRFLHDAAQYYRLDQASRQKLRAVYNPCRIPAGAAVSRLAAGSPDRRLRVLWAGRLDAEKRVDLLFDIVRRCAFADFVVFGQSVVDQEKDLPALPNLTYRGPFANPADLVAGEKFDVFIFTSRWEGLPNIIVEVGALGIPVIAPTVGGIGELISGHTGYPLPERPAVADYEAALRRIAADPEEAARRSEALLKLIAARHAWHEFVQRVREIPEYFSPARASVPAAAPRVSVIIPCYNQGKYLYESVSSALLAYSGPLEVIVVDDGSTDPKTAHYLQQAAALADSVQVLRQPNRGLSGARNAGLARATGDYIQFLDADDLLSPGKLDFQVAQMTAAPDLDVSVCNFLICEETRSHFYKPGEAIAGFDLSRADFLYNWERGFSIPIHCGLFRAAFLAETPFDCEMRAKEDWVFWCSLALKGMKIAYLAGHYAIYRQHQNSMRRSYVSMGKSWLKAALKIDAMVHVREPLFLDSAVSWFEQCYRKHPEYQKEISRLQAGAPEPPAASPTDGLLRAEAEPAERLPARLKFLEDPVAAPLLTVVIPVYNHYDYLADCLSSLADQGVPDMEVICIDDASTDVRVRAVLQSLAGQLPGLRVILNEQNRGIATTQNVAVECARGRYIAFLDCDDALPPGALARVREEIIRHPAADYFFTDRVEVDESGQMIRLAKYGGYDQIRYRGPEYIRGDLLDGMIASHLKVIRRQVYLDVAGCGEEFSGVQDWELALKIAEAGTFIYIPEPLYRHRIHAGSVTSSARVEQFRKTNMLRRRFARRWLAPAGHQPAAGGELQKLMQSGTKGAYQLFTAAAGLPSLDQIKACLSRGEACVFDLRGRFSIDPVNFVREYNSYLDLILWDDPATAAALIGYLWGDVLWRP